MLCGCQGPGPLRRQESGWWNTFPAQALWQESHSTGWAHSPQPVLSLHVEPRMGQDYRRVELLGDRGQKNPRAESEGKASRGKNGLWAAGTLCQPTTSSLMSTATAVSCPAVSAASHNLVHPFPTGVGTQNPDSLFCHLIIDHPVIVAFVLPFLHGPPHSLLQCHGGLQAGQRPEHWAIIARGQS